MIPVDYSKDTDFEVFCDKDVFNILDIFIFRLFTESSRLELRSEWKSLMAEKCKTCGI